MNELFVLVERLRDQIKKYRGDLSKSEALTRYVLVDPVLRALGWDTEDPEAVKPEEKQGGGVPDYVLYHNGKPVIALEVKSLNTKLDEEDILDLGFKYSWKARIPYFIITDGNIWRVYEVLPENKMLLEINIFEESIEDVVRKLLSLWKPLIKVAEKTTKIVHIEPIAPREPRQEEKPEKPEAGKELDLDKVKAFYGSLTDRGKAFIKIAFEAWKQGRRLGKDEIISELRKRGINVNKRSFTGIKSGITKLSEKMGLPPPIPTGKELGERYYKEKLERYVLRDEWGRALEKIIKEL